MTRRTGDGKQSYPIPVWNGIFEHYDRIADAIWEFLWCIDKVTVERDGVGMVLGGAPVKLEKIVAELEGSRKETVRKHFRKLVAEKFITMRRTPYGQVIGVLNSKKFDIWKRKEKPQNTVSPDNSPTREKHQKRVSLPPEKHQKRVRETRKARQRNTISVVSKEDSAVDSAFNTAENITPYPGVPIPLSQDQKESGGYAAESSSSSGKAPAKKNDDDSAAGAATLSPDAADRIEVLLEKAKTILVSRGHEHDYVEIALDLVEQRAVARGKAPATVQYYLASFETHLSSREESDLVRDLVEKRRARYAKFGIPLDPTTLRLTPEQEDARGAFNERHKGTTVEPDSQIESKVLGLAPAPESLAERAAEDDRWRPSTYGEAIDLLQFENNELYHDAAWRLVHRFAKHRGRFSSAENRERFRERLRRLHVEKIAEDEKESERERKRKKRAVAKSERQRPPTDAPEKEKP